MGSLLAFLVVVAAVVVAAGAVGAYVLASRSKKAFAEANQVIPGRTTRAPASWAGSHDAEAVLHRRLRDAMAALRANRVFDDDGALIDVRVELEEQALALDDELVAVAALPNLHRHEPLAKVTEAVNTIEVAVAELASRPTLDARPRLEEVLHRIRERASIVDEIRAELDQLPDGAPVEAPSTGEGEPGSAATSQTGSPGAPAASQDPDQPDQQAQRG